MKQKSTTVGIFGLVNSGKSTLINTLIGHKIAASTRKPHTTFKTSKGIVVHHETQLIFIDTPGLDYKKGKEFEGRKHSILKSLKEIDLLCILIDGTKKIGSQVQQLIENLKEEKLNIPIFAIINKIDVIHKPLLLPIVDELANLNYFKEIFIISALKNLGIEKMLSSLSGYANQSPWLYDDDIITDLSERDIAAEFTREQLFVYIHQEIPYNVKVITTQFQETDKSIKIHQSIIVPRSGYKKIIIGEKGKTLAKIGEKSRLSIEQILGKKVHLLLHVSVKDIKG